MKKATFARAAGLGLAVALAVTGCSANSGAETDGKTTITFLTHWGPDQVTMLEKSAAEFSKANPNITVKIQAVPFGNLLSTLRTQGASPDGPTISGIYDLWLPELVRDGLADRWGD